MSTAFGKSFAASYWHEDDWRRMLRSIDAFLTPTRTAAAVDREIDAVRRARRRGRPQA